MARHTQGTRKRRLATGSTRDTDWQLAEYRKLMGREAAERQEMEARAERGDCTCARFTIRTKGGYRTIHVEGCSKYKPWMEEHQKKTNEAGDAHARAASE